MFCNIPGRVISQTHRWRFLCPCLNKYVGKAFRKTGMYMPLRSIKHTIDFLRSLDPQVMYIFRQMTFHCKPAVLLLLNLPDHYEIDISLFTLFCLFEDQFRTFNLFKAADPCTVGSLPFKWGSGVNYPVGNKLLIRDREFI